MNPERIQLFDSAFCIPKSELELLPPFRDMPSHRLSFNESDDADKKKSKEGTGDHAGKNPGGVHDIDRIDDQKTQSSIGSKDLSDNRTDHG